jgi:hypothetical protein
MTNSILQGIPACFPGIPGKGTFVHINDGCVVLDREPVEFRLEVFPNKPSDRGAIPGLDCTDQI